MLATARTSYSTEARSLRERTYAEDPSSDGGAEGLRQFCVAQAILTEHRRRRREPTWFPYSSRRARLLERLMGFMFG